MSTAPYRLAEKAMCEILVLAVPDSTFVPQKGDDAPPDPPPGQPPVPAPDLEMPYNVVGVMDKDSSEVISGSGVYQIRAALVMLSNMNDDKVQVHEAVVRKCYDALKNIQLPQGWVDDADPTDFITITGIDIDGPPVDVKDDDGQSNCDAVYMTLAANTQPLTHRL